ncbi:MAG: hypothetical protein LBM75_09295 [Myxococcales bacterium]|nr:hypothetical protein [Myxococcales bacterium]
MARPDRLAGRAIYLGKWSPHWAAFAEGWAGARHVGGALKPDWGGAVGLRGEW